MRDLRSLWYPNKEMFPFAKRLINFCSVFPVAYKTGDVFNRIVIEPTRI